MKIINAAQEHGALCTQRKTYHDADGSLSAHRRCRWSTMHARLTMTQMDHSVPIGGAVVHFRLDQWFTSRTQNRCLGGRSQLNWAIISAMSTTNTVQEHYARKTCHDADGSLSAHRRCFCALSSRPVVYLRKSDPVLVRAFPGSHLNWAIFPAVFIEPGSCFCRPYYSISGLFLDFVIDYLIFVPD